MVVSTEVFSPGVSRAKNAICRERLRVVTGDDLLVLQPGDTVTHTWGIQAFGQ